MTINTLSRDALIVTRIKTCWFFPTPQYRLPNKGPSLQTSNSVHSDSSIERCYIFCVLLTTLPTPHSNGFQDTSQNIKTYSFASVNQCFVAYQIFNKQRTRQNIALSQNTLD